MNKYTVLKSSNYLSSHIEPYEVEILRKVSYVNCRRDGHVSVLRQILIIIIIMFNLAFWNWVQQTPGYEWLCVRLEESFLPG